MRVVVAALSVTALIILPATTSPAAEVDKRNECPAPVVADGYEGPNGGCG